MDYSAIKSLALAQSYKEEDQIWTDNLLVYANIAYHKIEKAIKDKVRNDYFVDFFKASLVDAQNEYTFDWATATNIWMDAVKEVNIKRSTNQTHTKLLPYSNSNRQWLSRDELAVINWGFFDIKDWSIFIYPTPTEAVADWLKMEAIVTLVDLTGSETESQIFPKNTNLRDWHYVISLWMKPYIYQHMGQYQEKIDANNEFENELDRMVKSLRHRYTGVVDQELPSSYHLTY